ncbi:hypothetical protein N4G62_01750 [Sphingomonas sanguinis]|uniref:DUF5671 domain-containing protein n=1 Tax=Sphingomonas sanguinis TaxID=33051 RepID=A0ABU5LLE1_9SPHN|nr:hypothetical protein [Sphingomonas sanguinis]MDZ7280749.1 hypothetical protein [Sphingomonas sanguinis]
MIIPKTFLQSFGNIAILRSNQKAITQKEKAFYGELALWIIVAISISASTFWLLFTAESPAQRKIIISHDYNNLTISLFLILFPVIFNAIFGALPLEIIRIRGMSVSERAEYRGRSPAAYNSSPPGIDDGPADQSRPSPSSGNTKHDSWPLMTLKNNADYSRLLASRIYARAGVYLLIGGLVALGGLWFFYSQPPISYSSKDLSAHIIEIAPRVSILFFIELIAFFFLRQYRGAMDEFRYYEAIQRHREEMVFAYYLVNDKGDNKAVLDAINSNMFSSKREYMPTGHSTESIELRKLESDDLAGIAKIIEGIGSLKK